MTSSDQTNELFDALASAQAELGNAEKDATNPHFKNDYATLASVREAVRPIHKHGLGVVQTVRAEGNAVTVETMLTHKSGQWVRDALTMTARDASPQSVGSAITYGRRYALAAIVGIASEDDDGEAAQPTVKRSSELYYNVQSTIPAAPAGPSTDEHGRIYVRAVERKPTKNVNVTRYEVMLSTGEVVSTIKRELANIAEQACQDNEPVEIETKASRFGTDLTNIKVQRAFVEKPAELTSDNIPF